MAGRAGNPLNPFTPFASFPWLVFIVVSSVVALVLTFTTADYARLTSAKEAEKIEVALGRDTLTTVNAIAEGWYYGFFARYVNNLNNESNPSNPSSPSSPSMERKGKGKGKGEGIDFSGFFGFEFEAEPISSSHSAFRRWLEKRTEAFLDLGYWFLRRLALFVVWLPIWIPMLILASLHGYWDREIKKTDFGYTSPVLNHWARSIMHLLTMITLLLFVVPVAIDPMIFPVFLILETILAGVAMGNVQKRI